jgi:hypothetical protein
VYDGYAQHLLLYVFRYAAYIRLPGKVPLGLKLDVLNDIPKMW